MLICWRTFSNNSLGSKLLAESELNLYPRMVLMGHLQLYSGFQTNSNLKPLYSQHPPTPPPNTTKKKKKKKQTNKQTQKPPKSKTQSQSPKPTYETQHKNKHIWLYSSSSAATSKEKGNVIRAMLEAETTKYLLLCLYPVTHLKFYHPIYLWGGNVISDIGEWLSALEAKWINTFFCVYRWPDALICELMHPHHPVKAEGGEGREKKQRHLPKLASSPGSWICWTTLKSIRITVE